MEEKQLNENESLQLIANMIQTAKTKISEDFWFYIIWGWAVSFASLSQYILVQINFEMYWLPWFICIPAGILVSVFLSRRLYRKKQVTSYLDRFMDYVWISFGISLLIVLVFQGQLGITATQPFIIVLYGIATFICGGVLQFKPLLVGGIACFCIAVASVFVDEQTQMLMICAAVVIAYLIPGYLLRKKYYREAVQ